MSDTAIDKEALRREVDEALHGQKKEPVAPSGFELNANSRVKHVIGVVSGKGGVGKSLVDGILGMPGIPGMPPPPPICCWSFCSSSMDGMPPPP